ncbi:hypothetical protein T492DRAFT_835902 [Pavlovales sp. CCMP2436]|nr:hypothetical protein T492DRAFT_835902 [Pavlovales sp. CCMP2436]
MAEGEGEQCEEELALAATCASELLSTRPLCVEHLSFRLVRQAAHAAASAAEAAEADQRAGVQDASIATALECLAALAPGSAATGAPYSNRAAVVRACVVGGAQEVASERGMCARLVVELIGASTGLPVGEGGREGALDAPSAARLVPLTLQPHLLARALGAAPESAGGAAIVAVAILLHWGNAASNAAAGVLGALCAQRRVALLLPEMHTAAALAEEMGVANSSARLWRLLADGAGQPFVFGTAQAEWAEAAAAAAAGVGGEVVTLWHVAVPSIRAQWAALESLLAPTALEAASAARLLVTLVHASPRTLPSPLHPCKLRACNPALRVPSEPALRAKNPFLKTVSKTSAVRAAAFEKPQWAAQGLLLAAGLKHALRDAPFGTAFLAASSEAEAARALPPLLKSSAKEAFKPVASSSGGEERALPAVERALRLLGNVSYTLSLRKSLSVRKDELAHFVDDLASEGGTLILS